MYVCIYICMYIYVCIYIYINICMHILYIYVHTHRCTKSRIWLAKWVTWPQHSNHKLVFGKVFGLMPHGLAVRSTQNLYKLTIENTTLISVCSLKIMLDNFH